MTYLDTHAVAALYEADVERFSAAARKAIEEDADLRISPMVLLELEYLHEIRRLKIPGRKIVDALAREIGLTICDTPFPEVVQAALGEAWTRDPFDRLILAQARLAQASLITRDEEMQKRYNRALA